jgi:AcrR family transcriptional regulator
MNETGDRDVDETLGILEAMHPDEAADPNEGLRERKKRRLRQQISDVATAMFLVHGFDNVPVTRIAAACEVSEQTVFNYFPTKESMFFDRTGSMFDSVVDAVRERGSVSLVEGIVRAMAEGPRDMGRRGAADEARQLHLLRLFSDVVTGSPTLTAVRLAEFARLVDELSVALAKRIDADAIDPEVRLAAIVVAGLSRVRPESTFRHVKHATSFAALRDLVRDDIRRAARLAEPTLTAFDTMRPTADS